MSDDSTGTPSDPPPDPPTEPMPVDPVPPPAPEGEPTTVMPAAGAVPPGTVPPGAVPPGGTVPPGGIVPPDEPPPPWYQRNAVLGAIAGLLVIALVIILIVWLASDDDDDAIDLSDTIATATTFPTVSTLSSTSVPQTTVPPTTVAPTTAPPTTAPPTTVPPTTVPPTTVPPTTVPPTTVPPTTVAPTTVPATTTPPTTAPPVAPDDATALGILQANPDQFSTLVALIERVGLDDDLSEPGQSFTIFAPTNDVFEGVDLSALNDDEVAAVLLHHIVPDALDSFAVFAESGELDTLNQPIVVDAGAQTVDGATITIPDLPATGDPDGWVHAIDSVLLP